MAARKPRAKEDLKAQILEAALPDIPFDGWTDELLERTAARLKLSQDDIAENFPEGPVGLIRYFSVWADEKMLAKIKAKKSDERISERITRSVRARLEILTPHKQAVSASLSRLAIPPHNLLLPKMVWKTSDAIWRAAGDTSTDYNYYTKRLLLSGVLTSTTLFWLNDKSTDAEKTWAFLDRRIANVLKIGRGIGKLREKRKKA